MATELSFIEYVVDQLSDTQNVAYKKMFGEYMIYCCAKPILLICDNTVYIKKHEFLDVYDLPVGVPYNGAKEHYILDPDNRELLNSVAVELEKITPLPKPRKKKQG